VAEPDDRHGLALQVGHAAGNVTVPAALQLAAQGQVEIAGEDHHQAQGVLGDGRIVQAGQVRDRDALALRSGAQLVRHPRGNELDPAQPGRFRQALDRRPAVGDGHGAEAAVEPGRGAGVHEGTAGELRPPAVQHPVGQPGEHGDVRVHTAPDPERESGFQS
jgi:hypothetical protein